MRGAWVGDGSLPGKRRGTARPRQRGQPDTIRASSATPATHLETTRNLARRPALLDVLLAGALTAGQVVPVLNATLGPLYDELGSLPPVTGTVCARLEVCGDTGRPTDLDWLTCTLVARPQGGGNADEAVPAALAAIAERLLSTQFPASGAGPTTVTVPVLFE